MLITLKLVKTDCAKKNVTLWNNKIKLHEKHDYC